MIIENKIEQTFSGPFIFWGLSTLAVTIIFVIMGHWIIGIAGFIIACFLLFTWSGIEIDTDKRTIRPFYMLFGLIKKGNRTSIESYIGLTLVPMQKVYTLYSNSNRKNSSSVTQFRVYLVDRKKKPALPLSSHKTNGINEYFFEKRSFKTCIEIIQNLSIQNLFFAG